MYIPIYTTRSNMTIDIFFRTLAKSVTCQVNTISIIRSVYIKWYRQFSLSDKTDDFFFHFIFYIVYFNLENIEKKVVFISLSQDA